MRAHPLPAVAGVMSADDIATTCDAIAAVQHVVACATVQHVVAEAS